MQSVAILVLGLAGMAFGWFVYSKFIATKIFQLDPDFVTPAHELNDGVDYLPTNKFVLWGHHFTSIAGAAPIVGPAIAVYWGWVPAVLWVTIGTIFFAGIHDWGAIWASARNKGKSMGALSEDVIGKRTRALFMIVIFLLLLMVNAVFGVIIAGLFVSTTTAVFPAWSAIVVALIIGQLLHRNFNLTLLTVCGVIALYASIYVGSQLPIPLPEQMFGMPANGNWIIILFVYAAIASMLPVWVLLQPRDFINGMQLFVGLFLLYSAVLLSLPEISAPAFNSMVSVDSPSLVPLLFVTIACGAVSGFHGLVSSGTTSKQISREPDSLMIGYGGMIGESLLGLLAVLACTAGFKTVEAWNSHYQNWASAGTLSEKMRAFIDGSALFISQLGIPFTWAQAFVALVAVSFALTSLDTGTRLLRYNINEMAGGINLPLLTNRILSSALATGAIGFFAFYQVDGRPAGLLLWKLFGSTNQVLGALTLLTIAIYLRQRKRNHWVVTIPMGFMIIVTLIAMVTEINDYWNSHQFLLLSVGGTIFLLSLWVFFEASLRFRKDNRSDRETLLK